MESTTVYLLRHAQTAYNHKQVIQGWLDIPLNEAGERQAARLGKRLAAYGIEHLAASDLQRTHRTAQIVCEHLNCPLSTDERWREIHLASWEGKSWEEIIRTDPQSREAYLAAWFTYRGHGGESWQDVYRRVTEAFEAFCHAHTGKKIAVVTHSGVIRTVLMHALKWAQKHHPLILENTSISELTYIIYPHDQRWWLKRINDAAHLENGFFA